MQFTACMAPRSGNSKQQAVKLLKYTDSRRDKHHTTPHAQSWQGGRSTKENTDPIGRGTQERTDGQELFRVKRNENSGHETHGITPKGFRSGEGADVVRTEQKELQTGDKKVSHIPIPSLCHMVY